MIVALDSSAAVCLFLGHPATAQLTTLVDDADDVVVSALCRAEVSVALDNSAPTRSRAEQWIDQLGRLWEQFWVVPVDQECLDLAAELASVHRLAISPAIHVAAFKRLARPVHLATLDPRQVPVAASLGFDVVELVAGGSAHAMLQPDSSPR